jgi:hypothetical protein
LGIAAKNALGGEGTPFGARSTPYQVPGVTLS